MDLEYDGAVFDMEIAVYAKDIPESGEVVLAGVTGKTAVIAIDRHGNESRVTVLEQETRTPRDRPAAAK